MSSPIDTSASVPPPGFPVSPAGVSGPPPGFPVSPPGVSDPSLALFAPAQVKSGTTAIVLTLAWPGAGHWYAGERDRGLAFAGATLLGAALALSTPVAGLIATIAFVWALVDARHAVARAAGR